MRSLKLRLPVVCCLCLTALHAEDPFRYFSTAVNKDFPTLRRTVVVRDKFRHSLKRWRIDPTWPGVLAHDKALVLTPAKRKGKEYGIALKLYRSVYPMEGKKYEFSTVLSGHGKAKIGLVIYSGDRNGRPVHRIVWSGECELGPVARKIVCDADCSRQNVRLFGLLLYIDAGGELICREAVFSELGDSSVRISSPYLLVVRKGEPLPDFHFEVRQTRDVEHPQVLLSTDDKNVNSSASATADEHGRVHPPRSVINAKTDYTLSVNGTTATTHVLPVSPSDYDRCDRLAKEIRPKKPLRIVVLGDSRLAEDLVFNVGCGACEQLFFWLDKYNPGLVTVKNVAAGGDTLLRAYERMLRELGAPGKRVYKQQIYAGMFREAADLVFIQFGNTDTALDTPDSETRGADGVTEENIRRPLEGIIGLCRERWPEAKIIVFSASGSSETICRQRHRDLRKLVPGRRFALYGVPECLEKYNRIARAAAQARGALYYDVYSEMTALPHEEKVKLLNPNDGVHLSHDGHVHMTMKYLELLRDVVGTSR